MAEGENNWHYNKIKTVQFLIKRYFYVISMEFFHEALLFICQIYITFRKAFIIFLKKQNLITLNFK